MSTRDRIRYLVIATLLAILAASSTPVQASPECYSCHPDRPTLHDMTDCYACHGPGSPLEGGALEGAVHTSAWLNMFSCYACHDANGFAEIPPLQVMPPVTPDPEAPIPEPPVTPDPEAPIPEPPVTPDPEAPIPEPPAAEPPVAPLFDATIAIWSDSEPLDFGVNPTNEGSEVRIRRVTLSVTSSQPYALTLKTRGDFAVLPLQSYNPVDANQDGKISPEEWTLVADSGGQALPPSIMSFSRDGSPWQPLASTATTVAEEPDVVGEVTNRYTFLFQVYAGQDPDWEVLAGGYEADVCFEASPIGVSKQAVVASPVAAKLVAEQPTTPEVVEAPETKTEQPPAAAEDPVEPGPPPAESTIPTPPPVVELLGTVTATLTDTPKAPAEDSEAVAQPDELPPPLMLWVADTELASDISTLTCADLVGRKLVLTVDGKPVGDLAPVEDSDLYVGQWNTDGVEAGEHLIEVVVRTGEDDPGFVCWSARIEVKLGTPEPLPDSAPATAEASVTTQPAIEPETDGLGTPVEGSGGGGG